MKSKNEFSAKISKKNTSSKLNTNNDNISSIIKEQDKYNIINKTNNHKEHLNNNLMNINQNINANNNINQFESKSKKDLQEFISNQLKSPNPNFSRINMNGYGIQYLCSFLHKNPNKNYKEI